MWDVALRDWPKAMLPAAALRPRDSFDGMVLKHAIREGQPILSVQLMKLSTAGDSQIAEATAVTAATAPPSTPAPQTDLWAPAEVPAEVTAPTESVSQAAPTAGDSEATGVAAAVPVETPAEPPGETKIPAPVVAEPVVVAASPSTDIDAAILPGGNAIDAGVTTAHETAMRYLVVPERIALEADRSFVPPPVPEQPGGAAAETVAQALPEQPSSSPPQANVEQGRGQRPTPRTSANRERQSKQSPRSAAGQAAPAKQPQQAPSLRSMMPGLSLGMGAVEPSAKPAAKPAAKSEQVPRSNSRGFGLFR